MKKFKGSILYILIVVLIGLNLNTLASVKDLNNKVNDYNNWIMALENDMRNMSHLIQTTADEDKLVQSFTYDMEPFDDETVKVHATLKLNKVPTDGQVYLIYESMAVEALSYGLEVLMDQVPEMTTEKILLVEEGTLTYKSDFVLNKRLEYDFKVLVESDAEKEAGNLGHIDLFNRYYQSPDVEMDFNTLSSDGTIDYSGRMISFEEGDLVYEKAITSLFYDGEVIESFDLLKDGQADEIGEENINLYFIDRKVTVPLKESEELDFSKVQIVTLVHTDTDITFKYTEGFH